MLRNIMIPKVCACQYMAGHAHIVWLSDVIKTFHKVQILPCDTNPDCSPPMDPES